MKPLPSPHRAQQGSSLAIILILMAILTLLIVAAMLSVSLETRQAASSLEQQRAESVAKVGIDEMSEKLSQIPLDKHWAAAPGLIRYWNGSDWNNTIDLHSGNTSADQVDLNAKLADGSYAILPPNNEYTTAPEMKVDWMYILTDGSLVKGPLTADQTPLGRFAYWTDLENARVNLNTAGFGMTQFNYYLANTPTDTIIAQYPDLVFKSNPWMTDRVEMKATGLEFPTLDRASAQQKTPQNLVGHPSSIDLSYLDGVSELQSFNTFRYAGSYFLRVDAKNSISFSDINFTPAGDGPDLSVRFFNTPEDWKMIVGDATYKKNKGYLTTRGRSPEINPWGLPKIPLTEVAKEGFALNELTENLLRTTPNSMTGGNYSQDSRRVQIPAMLPMDASVAGGRSLFRDLNSLYYWCSNQNVIADLGGDLMKLLSAPFPGYGDSLASKYNQGSSDETEQIALELMSFLDYSLNGGSAGVAPTVHGADLNLEGLSASKIGTSTTRRTGSGGPLLINEIALQAESVPVSSLVWPAPYDYFSVWGLDKTPNPFGLPPIAALTSQASNLIYLYLTRDVKPTDYFIKVILKGELMTSAHNGLIATTSSGQSLTTRLEIYATNNRVSWTSDEPASGSGSLSFDIFNFNLPNATQKNYLKRLNLATMYPNFSFPTRPISGNNYAVSPMSQFGQCLLVGPFAAGTRVSSLNIRLRLQAQNVVFGNGYEGNLWQMFPGIFPDFAAGSTATDPSISDTYLEFNFPDIDISSPATHYASLEVNDPRVSRRKSDWKPAAVNSLGAENSIYAGGSTDASDLSRPPSLLQTIRGRLRKLHISPEQGTMEYQNASRILGLPGVGYFSSMSTGVDAGTPWKTLKFYNAGENPPDWLWWNLFYVPFDRSMLNQTDGKLNINATLHPFGIKRVKPLEALLGNRVANAASLASAIANGPHTSDLPSDIYVYAGEICDVPGLADSGDEYTKEALPRDLADLISTQCSDFRVFMVAQALKKLPNGKIVPTSTHRAEVTLSRVADVGPQTYSFGEMDLGLSKIYKRGAYEAQGVDAPRIDLNNIKNNERSVLGLDRQPNTADDWLIPQKIEIGSYRTVQ